VSIEQIRKAVSKCDPLITEGAIWYEGRQDRGNGDLSLDMTCFSKAAYGFVKLGIDVENWNLRVKELRNTRKLEAIELKDYSTALDIEREYIMFLLKTGEPGAALELANKISDDYETEDNKVDVDKDPFTNLLLKMQSDMQKYAIGQARPRILRDIACHFSRLGDIETAKQIMPADENGGNYYYLYSSLAEYYQEKNDLKNLTELVIEFENTNQNSGPGFERGSLNQAKAMLAKILFNNGRYKETIHWLTQIDAPRGRTMHMIEAVKKAIKIENWEFARQLSIRVLDECSEFEAYEAVDDRIGLASSIGQTLGFEDIVERCIEGDDPDGRESIMELIFQADKQTQSSLWGNFLKLVAQMEDWVSFEEYLQLGFQKYPNSQDFFRSLQDSFTKNISDDMILQIPDLTNRASVYADFVFANLLNGESLESWKPQVDLLESMEDKIVSQEQAESDKSEWDLSALANQDSEVPEDSNKLTHVTAGNMSFGLLSTPEISNYHRKTNDLIPNIAKLALIRRNFFVFEQIMIDPRLPKHSLAFLISKAAELAIDGTEPELWWS
jgi:hypothetical protein